MMFKGKFVFPVFASFLILTAFASVSEAKTIYVPDDYARIQWAVNAASAGDTIIVRDGIYYESITVSKHLTIKSENGSDNCIVDSGGFGDVITLYADGITIEGFTVRNSSGSCWPILHAGIKVFSNANRIAYNCITNNWAGVYLGSSYNNNIIANNTVSNNEVGIYLDYSSNNIIANNTVSSNNDDGINLWSSSNNIIANNTLLLNGMSVLHSYDNTVVNNTVNGKPLVYLENVSDYIVEDAGQVIAINSNNITVKNSNFSYASVEFRNTSNSKIINNTVSSNNWYGIDLWYSDNNIIANNTVSNNYDGIVLRYSSNNTIANNIASSNNYYGIAIWDSSNNIIANNTVSNNDDGIDIAYSSNNNIIANNTVSSNNWYGIVLYGTNNIIANNNISSNYYSGICLGSSNNTITNNTVSNNWYGIVLYGTNNIIYLNNFIDNTHQFPSYAYDSKNIWNSTEKINYTYNGKQFTNYLGNYWSDYTGSDADEDGIGDTPYSINLDKDNYPLMERFENYFVPPTQYGVYVCVPSCAPKIISAFPGSNISFVLKVMNTGTEEDTVLLSVTDELGWDFEYPEKIELAPGEEKYFFLNFTPPDYAYNKNEIYVKAVSASDKSKVSMCSVRYHPISYYKINCPLLFEFLFETEEELEVEEVSEFVKVSEFSPTPAGQLVLSIFVEPVGGRVKNIIKVKSKETGESVAIPFTTVNHTAITTDFKFPDDSYSFENWGTFITIPILDWELGIRGRCFGMSETCLLFYEGIYELPEGRHCLYEVQKDDKTTLYNIPVSTLITIHQIRLKNTLAGWLKEFAKTDNRAEYMNLKRNISRNEPVILVMLGGKSSKGKEKALHTCVAYGIIEVGNKAYILMYDNNIPYKNDAIHFSLSYACAVLDKEKWSFKYSGYSKMMVVKATPLLKAELEQLLSEGNISTLPRSYISNITIQRND